MSSTTRAKQTAIVTGASSGIGLGLAKAFLDRGDNIVINARNEDRLHSVARDLGDDSRIAVVAGDIGLKETSETLVSTALERFGRVDALVNNGGHFFPKPFGEYTEEDLDQFLRTHLKGNYFASQAVAVPSASHTLPRVKKPPHPRPSPPESGGNNGPRNHRRGPRNEL